MKACDNNVEWLHIGSITCLSFIASDVLIYGNGCCLKFLNLGTGHYSSLIANRHCVNGDGIRTARGHRSVYIFAYAESSSESEVHVREYPTFKTIAKFTDGPPEGYSTLTFSETSLLIALGAIPNFVFTIWNWRTREKLGELDSNIKQEHQLLRCSWGSPVSMAQLGTGSDKLYLWDVFICCKTAVLGKHELKYQKDNFNPAHFNDCMWTREGDLYVVDLNGSFYSMTPGFDLKLEVSIDLKGELPTSISDYKSGIAISGPNKEIRHYIKHGSWKCNWTLALEVGIRRVFSNRPDYLVGVTVKEEVVKITRGHITRIKRTGSNFIDFCMVYPTGEYVAALRQNRILDIYAIDRGHGNEISRTELNGKALVIAENPELPYIAIGFDNGTLQLMSIYKPEQPSVMATFNLTRNPIENIKFFEHGCIMVVGCSDVGEFFIIEGLPGTRMNVIACVEAKLQIVDFMLVACKNCYRLFLLPVNTNCFESNKLIRYCIITKSNVNIKDYILDTDEFYYHGLVPTRTTTRDRIFYAIPSNSRNIHILETKRGDNFAKIISIIKTGHQMRKIGLHITKYHALTWGYDGFIIARDNNFEENVGMALPHHRYYGGVKKAYIDPLGKYIISLGRENNLICTKIVETEIDEDRKKYLAELKDSVKFTLMFKRPTIGFRPEERFHDKTWKEVEELLRKEEEENLCRLEKEDILEEFSSIKAELMDIVTKNLEGPENEKLDLLEFYLDTGLLNTKRDLNREQCYSTNIYLKALIVAQDKVTEHLLESYWNKMRFPGQVLRGMFVNTVVVKYTLLPDDLEKIKELSYIEEQRKIEKFLSLKGSFQPWMFISDEELQNVVKKPIVPTEDYDTIDVLKLMEHLDTKAPGYFERHQAMNGAVTLQFIDVNHAHYHQREIVTFYQCLMQQIIAENEVLKLKLRFNETFDEMVNQKYRDVAYVTEKNIRLREIISEFNYFSTTKFNLEIVDPTWKQLEQPDRILKVVDSEMSVVPYISPSQQAILDAQAAEEERIRLALLADDFKERALMAMMNGVLEVRWEDELKKDVPIPKCMIEKEPEQFNEEDLRAIRDYEENVVFLNRERERYKNMLDNEFTRLSLHLRDIIRKFNTNISTCLEFKMDTDSASNQENLKVNRVRNQQSIRILLMDKEEQMWNNFNESEGIIEELRGIISSLNTTLDGCRVEMDVHHTKERVLEKAFKKDIQEMSPVVQEQAVKLYKKRPRTVFHDVISSDIYVELARCVANHDKSLALTDDCLDFLRSLNIMGQFVGLPHIIDENTYDIICRHRKFRIEFELKLKAFQTRIKGGEATIGVYQKRLRMNKEKSVRLQNELQQSRVDYLHLMHNIQVQLVLRRGLIEVPLTGRTTDFSDAILISRNEVETINQLIRDAGFQKIKAIMCNMTFRRNIMTKEWEHKRQRMLINDLLEHLYDIDNITLTREMREFLRAKRMGRKLFEQSAESELENIARAYQLRLNDMQEKHDELRKQIRSYNDHNDALDKAIRNINIDVCDLNLQVEDNLTEKENKALKLRMNELFKRGTMLRQIQDNHSEIMIMQTELELLRLKRYPAFKYKLINK